MDKRAEENWIEKMNEPLKPIPVSEEKFERLKKEGKITCV